MNLEEFKNVFKEENNIGVDVSENKIEQLYEYMNLLLEWNEKMNLTAITEPNEVIKKHFIDSLTISQFISDNSKVIDVGTGAGFPGVPLAITRNIDVTLLDSLNKRINFLSEVALKLKLGNVTAVHGRAEEVGQNKNYREKYDFATSRAVAPMNVLLEYLLPFVKVGGCCICMKGPNVNDDISNINNALKLLGGMHEKTINLKLGKDIERNIVIIRKVQNTCNKYPRKPGTPSKQPL